MTNRKIRFGLNYVPSKRWYYCWNDWDRSEIAEDFDAIAALEADHLRVMLVWPWFQPNPAIVSRAHLKRLDELMAEAEKRNLDVIVCPLTGWLSGYRFLPPWVWEPESLFTDEETVRREKIYFQAILDEIGSCPNFFGFDLGNEINVMVPRLPREAGDRWGREVVSWLRGKAPGKWIVNGTDHLPWFQGNTFSVEHLTADYDAATIHAWPLFTGCLERGPLDAAPSVHLSAFLTHLCRRTMSKTIPVWIQEFGCSRRWGTGKSKETYLRESVRNAIRAGATWFTWWCSHDIDAAYRFDDLEYDLGLLTVSNEEKPLAGVFREQARRYGNADATPEPLYEGFGPGFEPAILPRLPDSQWVEQNLETTTWAAFDRYLRERV